MKNFEMSFVLPWILMVCLTGPDRSFALSSYRRVRPTIETNWPTTETVRPTIGRVGPTPPPNPPRQSIDCQIHSCAVTIKQGVIIGCVSEAENKRPYSSFLGIPYAEPPLGQKRFRDPEPHTGWKGVFYADSFGHSCPQSDTVMGNKIIGQEDCLNLNVYTPKVHTDNPLPVMLFVHGGYFLTGRSKAYGAGKLLADGSVVLVVANYRLGVLGFLSTDDREAAGNYGMMDLVMALQWVKYNIGQFGGDPGRVTIFGQSSGAVSVALLLLSPTATGLFHAAITESGSPLSDWAVESQPRVYAEKLSRSLGCNTNSSMEILICLRGRTTAELVQMHIKHRSKAPLKMRTSPVVDRHIRNRPFLPYPPEIILINGNFNRVPLITGVTLNEAQMHVTGALKQYSKRLAIDPHFLENKVIPDTITSYTDTPLTKNKLYKLKKFYFKNINFTNIEEAIPPFAEMMSTIIFFAGQDWMVKLYSKWAPVYAYLFEYHGSTFNKQRHYAFNIKKKLWSPVFSVGVWHSDELPFLFDNPFTKPFTNVFDRQVQKIMTHLWTTFATYGTPNNPQPDPTLPLNYWSQYNIDTQAYYRIGPYPYVNYYFRKFELDVYEEYYDHDNTNGYCDDVQWANSRSRADGRVYEFPSSKQSYRSTAAPSQ